MVAIAHSVSPTVRLYYEALQEPEDHFPTALSGTTRVPQADGDLGDRLREAFKGIFGDGFERAAILGADSPTLPAELIRSGLAAVRDRDVALGPTEDGGYYLVAVRRIAWPRAVELFREIPWSTGAVFQETLERADAAGLTTRILDGWYDIDRPEDLVAARRDAAGRGHLGRLLEGW